MNSSLIDQLLLACFTCMKTSDEALNNATGNAILVMLAVVSLPMLGFLGMVTRVIICERSYRRQAEELELENEQH